RQQLREQVGRGDLLHGRAVPLDPAAVVLELRLEPLQVLRPLVERRAGLVQLRGQGRDLRVLTLVLDLALEDLLAFLLGFGHVPGRIRRGARLVDGHLSGGLRRSVIGLCGIGGDIGLLFVARRLLRHAAPSFGFCSSSTISASTTSSSPSAFACSPPSAPPASAPPASPCAPCASAYMAWPSFWLVAATFSLASRIAAVSSPLSFSWRSSRALSTSVLISPGTFSSL